MSQYAGHGMDVRIDHTAVHRLRIADMKKSIRCELAKFLDCGLTNWEILAEELNCHPTDIDVLHVFNILFVNCFTVKKDDIQYKFGTCFSFFCECDVRDVDNKGIV